MEGEQITATSASRITLDAVVDDDGVPKRRSPGWRRGGVEHRSRRDVDSDDAQALQNPHREPRLQPAGRVTVGKTVGLHLSWIVYRGTGKVRFDPEQINAWEDTRAGANSPWAPCGSLPMPADGKVTVQATFDRPGTYLLRAIADDGALLGDADITVTVTK